MDIDNSVSENQLQTPNTNANLTSNKRSSSSAAPSSLLFSPKQSLNVPQTQHTPKRASSSTATATATTPSSTPVNNNHQQQCNNKNHSASSSSSSSSASKPRLVASKTMPASASGLKGIGENTAQRAADRAASTHECCIGSYMKNNQFSFKPEVSPDVKKRSK
jgi:hypothetical protein